MTLEEDLFPIFPDLCVPTSVTNSIMFQVQCNTQFHCLYANLAFIVAIMELFCEYILHSENLTSKLEQ